MTLDAESNRSLEFQLLQNTIDLVWALLNLAEELKTQSRGNDADEALESARTSLLKAKRQSSQLSPDETATAAPSLELLGDVLKSIAALP